MFRKFWLTIAGCAMAYVLILASAVGSSAQTGQSFQYVIPHFSASTGSQLLISNLSGVGASPEVALRDSSSGQLADTFISVGAGTQQRLTAASFGLSSFEGTVVVTSRVRLSVMATLAIGDAFETTSAFETAFDPGNPILGAAESIIPFSQGTTGLMRVTVYNPNTSQTTFVITPVQQDGTLLNSVQASVPALGTVKEDIAALFPQPVTGPRDISHLLIRVPSSIFGPARGVLAQAEMVNFSDANEGIAAPRADFSAVNAVPVSEGVLNGTIAFFTEGGDYATELQFINTGTVPANVTLTANGRDGNAAPGTAPAMITIPPNGAIRRNIQNIFTFEGGSIEGAITFNSTTKVIATEAIAGISRTSFVVRPPGSQQDTSFVFPVRDFDARFFTGLTFLNPDLSTAANLTLRYISDDGTPTSAVTLTLDPSSGTAETTAMLGTLMPEAQAAGFIHVQADVPIIASALEGALDNSALAALPVIHPQAGYVPPDSGGLLITGTVRRNDAALAGATVQLTGPVIVSAITDSNGAYKLAVQPATPGDYTITATETGYIFSPALNVHIDGPGSSRNNDFTATLQTPVITAVQPTGIVAGSGSTTLVVAATPVAPNAQIIFDGKPLNTTLITAPPTGLPSSGSGSSGSGLTGPALQAVVDSSLLSGAHQATIVVQTKDSIASAQSQPFLLGIGTVPPVLTSFGPLPVPIMAGCCPTTANNPGLTTTISGSGFTQGVTVQVGTGTGGVISNVLANLGPDSGVSYISPTSILVTIPAQYLSTGGFLEVTATNPAPSAGPSNALLLTVFNQAAIVTSITPNVATVQLEQNSPPLRLTANGFGFKPGATLSVGGTPVALDPTQPQTANSISGLVPSTLIQVGGTVPVTVVNPNPVTGTPTSVPLNLLNLPPVLLTVQPTNGPLYFDTQRSTETYNASVVVTGANYNTASIFELVNQCAPIAVAPTTATVPIFQKQQFTAYLSGLQATQGDVTWSVAFTTATGTQGSPGQIDVNGLYTAPAAVPTPATVIVTATSKSDGTKFAIATVTITQTPNGSASSVGALGAALVNSHEAILTVTISCAGNYLIDVRNPQPGGGVSQKAAFTVNPYQPPDTPTITSFDPPTAPGLNVPFTLTINGSGFEISPNQAYVSFNGTVLFPTSINSSTIVVNVPGYLISDHGNIPLAVVNPDYGASPIASYPVF